MYYDSETDKEFTPKKYCTCIDNKGKKRSLTYMDIESKPPEEMCAYCGHVTWQQYIKRQVGHKLNRKYYG